MKRYALILLGLYFTNPAQAGLFSGDDALKLGQDNQKEIQQLEARILKLEENNSRLVETNNRQTRSMLDLQSQIETLNGELRKLRGQNEELAHGLGDAEKRAKDFYLDLDTRIRHFESAEEAEKNETPPAGGASAASAVPSDASTLASENRAFESAYALFRNGQYANAVKALHEFLKKYPESAHAGNATYWLGSAKFALKDYKGALGYFQNLLKMAPNTPKAAETMLNIAGCQKELKQPAEAKKMLKQLIAKYPDSEAAAKAKKQLASAK